PRRTAGPGGRRHGQGSAVPRRPGALVRPLARARRARPRRRVRPRGGGPPARGGAGGGGGRRGRAGGAGAGRRGAGGGVGRMALAGLVAPAAVAAGRWRDQAEKRGSGGRRNVVLVREGTGSSTNNPRGGLPHAPRAVRVLAPGAAACRGRRPCGPGTG